MEQQPEKYIYDCIVIGGGISGISFASCLGKEGDSILILEKEKALGGRIRSANNPKQHGFWREMGAHTCYNSYTELIHLIKESGNEDKIIPLKPLSYKLYNRKKICGVMSEIGFPEMIFHCWRYFTSDKHSKTTREYFEPVVGKSNYRKLFSKLFRAVISQEADLYPAEIFLKQRASKDESLSRRFSYRGGLSRILEDLAADCGADVQLSARVTHIAKKGDGTFEVTLQTGQSFLSRRIAVATDIGAAPELLSQAGLTKTPELLRSIAPSESIAVNVSVEKEKTEMKELAGIIPLSDDFFSAVSGDTVENDKWRSFTFHFPESKLSSAERLEIIFRVLNVQNEQDIETETYRHILPAMRMEHLNMDEKTKDELAASGVFVVGNYFDGMSLEDCVRRAKKESVRFNRRG